MTFLSTNEKFTGSFNVNRKRWRANENETRFFNMIKSSAFSRNIWYESIVDESNLIAFL